MIPHVTKQTRSHQSNALGAQNHACEHTFMQGRHLQFPSVAIKHQFSPGAEIHQLSMIFSALSGLRNSLPD